MPTKTQHATQTPKPSTRDHLISVGLDLMRRHGYTATGLQEILQAAGVPKGSFYHHFPSKEEFTVALIDRYFTTEAKHCQAVLGNTRQAPLKRLQRYFEDLIQMAGQTAAIQGCLLGNLSVEVASSSALLQTHLSSSFQSWQSAMEQVLNEAVEKGSLRKSLKPKSLAGFILNSWEGALLRSQADKSDVPLNDFLRYIFEELLTK